MLNVTIRTSDTGPIDLPGDLRSTLDGIADDWTREIRQRTRSGKGADGRQMRRKADGSPATLRDSGEMLRSLQADVGDRRFEIAPTGARNIVVARTHQRTGRRFMGADERQIADARQTVADALQRDRK